MDRAAYIDALLGIPHDRVARHCWWLVVKVQADLFGQALPSWEADYPGIRDRPRIMASHPLRAVWHPVDLPADGDIVMMGRAPGRDVHAGVYLVGGGRRGVLHTDAPHGVILESLVDLAQLRRWRPTAYRRAP